LEGPGGNPWKKGQAAGGEFNKALSAGENVFSDYGWLNERAMPILFCANGIFRYRSKRGAVISSNQGDFPCLAHRGLSRRGNSEGIHSEEGGRSHNNNLRGREISISHFMKKQVSAQKRKRNGPRKSQKGLRFLKRQLENLTRRGKQ